MLASYYWLAEAYQYHSDTLKTVVLDVSMLRSIPDEAYYQKALMEMRFSGNKLEAIKACTDTLDDFLAYLFPIVSYHTSGRSWTPRTLRSWTMMWTPA